MQSERTERTPGRTPKLTYEDYLELPEDRMRYEILNGELYVSPSPFHRHQLVSSRLYRMLFEALDRRDLGQTLYAPFDVLLGKHDIVQPDLLFIRKERLNVIDPERGVLGPPDLAVEIVSPSNRRRDTVVKARRYARGGVPLYWIVDPKQNRLIVKVLRDGQYEETFNVAPPGTYESREWPGLVVDLDALFA